MMESNTPPIGLDRIVEGDKVIIGGNEIDRVNIHYMDQLITVLLDGGVYVGDRYIHIKNTEYDIFKVLTSLPGKSWKKSEFLDEDMVYGFRTRDSLRMNAVSLKKKIEMDLNDQDVIQVPGSKWYTFIPQGEIIIQTNPKRDEYKQLYQDDKLEIFGNYTIISNGHEKNLGPVEYKLLTTMASNPGYVWEKNELIDMVWGVGEGSVQLLNRVMKTLRIKIETDPNNPLIIITHPRAGTSFNIQGKLSVNDYATKPDSYINTS